MSAIVFGLQNSQIWCKNRRRCRFSCTKRIESNLSIGGFHVTSSPPCWWTVNKRSLISSLCLSTSICSFHHCYLCLPRMLENHPQKYELTCCCRYGSNKIIIFSSHYSVTQFTQTDTHVLFEVMRYQVVLRHFNILINICQILLS